MTLVRSLRAASAAGATAVAATVSLTLLPGGSTEAAVAGGPADQVGTWGTAVDSTALELADRTVRNIVHTSVGGSGLRISLSNAHGSVPVTFDSVWVGRVAEGAAVEPGSNERLTFGNSTSVTVPVGAEVLSDPVPGELPAHSTLAVSIHVVGDAGRVSGHRLAHQTSYVSTPGDHAADEDAQAFSTPTRSYAWVESAVVRAPQQVETVVVLGDSITDGDRSTAGANRRWPNYLARRVLAQPEALRVGIMNAGISGNRVLADGSGASVLSRFDRDVLAQPGVGTVVIAAGINDLRSDSATKPADLINAYRALAARAHARGICIVGSTITPWQGESRWSARREAIRLQVNQWVRTSGTLDGVVDLDAAIRDPQHRSRMLPAFDSGDHLHPADAGYEAMANAVDLRVLDCRR